MPCKDSYLIAPILGKILMKQMLTVAARFVLQHLLQDLIFATIPNNARSIATAEETPAVFLVGNQPGFAGTETILASRMTTAILCLTKSIAAHEHLLTSPLANVMAALFP